MTSDKYIKVIICKLDKGLVKIIQAILKLMIPLSLPPEYCDDRCASPENITILKEVG